jgi:hypothetical protein
MKVRRFSRRYDLLLVPSQVVLRVRAFGARQRWLAFECFVEPLVTADLKDSPNFAAGFAGSSKLDGLLTQLRESDIVGGHI